MPGTIQVTVLEFKGVSSSSKASAKSLKVSMGKRQFQTWDKGDFSFPITKLGENLVVSLLDAGGNEIAHQDILTMQIIEKGNWDEVFAVDGGGHVHMKLRFVLSEEERRRIRLMRESAVKKKLETDPSIKLRLLQVSDSVETSTKNEPKISDSQKGYSDIDEVKPKVEGSQAGSSLSSAASSANVSSHPRSIPETALIPDATDGKHELISESPQLQETVPHEPLSNIKSGAEEGPPSSKPSDNKNTIVHKLLNEKTPSSVRKMISAFESSQTQEAKSLKRVSSVPAQLNRRREATVSSEDQESKPEKSLTDCDDHIAETVCSIPSEDGSFQSQKELPSSIPSGENDLQIIKISPLNLTRQSTSETATCSGRVLEEQAQVSELSSNSINITDSSAVQGSGIGRGTGLKSSSNEKPTLDYYNEECQASGMWIFPDNATRLCVTTAGRHHRDNISSKSNALDKNAMHETEEAGSGSPPNGSFNGVIGQVIKIGVIIGFGVLVLLTRQKEPRKKQREENDNLFLVQEYV